LFCFSKDFATNLISLEVPGGTVKNLSTSGIGPSLTESIFLQEKKVMSKERNRQQGIKSFFMPV
jgi:hypothetical protein